MARDIVEGNSENIKGTVQEWSYERIAKGDWGGVQFLSPHLCERFIELREDKVFATRELGRISIVGPEGRRIRDAFRKSEIPDSDALIALWHHKTDLTKSMLSRTTTYMIPKKGKEKLAASYWAMRGHLLLPNRLRLTVTRCVSVRHVERTLGSAWVPCKLDTSEYIPEFSEKALCAYLNSTIGILAILGDRSNKIPSYPQFSLDDLRRIPVPDFNALGEARVSQLAAAYDALCEFTLRPLPQIMQDETRLALDRIVTDALDIQPEVVATIRRELSREPSVTGKPYEP